MKLRFDSAYLDSAALEQFVAKPWANQGVLTVVKAHDIGPAAIKALRAGSAKAICTFRDPRDCVASDWHFSACPFEICVKRISGTLEPIRLYQTTPNVLMVRYEDMMHDRHAEIRRIARHLGIQPDDSAIELIDSKTSFETCKKVCDGLMSQPDGQVLQIADHRVDPATHLHDNHLNGGTIGRWKQDLTPDQIDFANEYFAPWLIKLGYETSHSLNTMLNKSTTSDGLAAESHDVNSISYLSQFV